MIPEISSFKENLILQKEFVFPGNPPVRYTHYFNTKWKTQ